MTGRPCAPRFEATIFKGSPFAKTTAPTAKAPSRSLGPSTKNDPSRPCGRPTRPIGTRSEAMLGELHKHIVPALPRRRSAFVLRPPVLEVERPIRARLVLVCHPDAPRVDDPLARHRAFALHAIVAPHTATPPTPAPTLP